MNCTNIKTRLKYATQCIIIISTYIINITLPRRRKMQPGRRRPNPDCSFSEDGGQFSYTRFIKISFMPAPDNRSSRHIGQLFFLQNDLSFIIWKCSFYEMKHTAQLDNRTCLNGFFKLFLVKH